MSAITFNSSASSTNATWALNKLKSNTNYSFPIANKILAIRSSSINPGETFNRSGKNLTHKYNVNTTKSSSSHVKVYSEGIAVKSLKSFFRSFIGYRNDSYDVSSSNLILKENIQPSKFSIIKPMSELPVYLLADKVIFNNSLRILVDKIRNDRLINEDFSTWQEQEQKVYIPSIINRAIDKMAALKTGNSKQIELLTDNRQNIMTNILKNLGIWDEFKDRTDLMACAQSSLGHIVSNYVMKQLENKESEFNHHLSNRVYEELFNCPGEIERVLNATQTEIKKILAPEIQS